MAFLLLFAVNEVRAQEYAGIPGRDQVTISDSGHTIRAHVYMGDDGPRPKPDRTYAWVKGDKLLITQGGYGGKLLDGFFREHFANKNLYKEGNYKCGLKKGEWRQWNQAGILQSRLNWKRGKRNGTFSLNDTAGHVLVSGKYKKDELSGKFLRIDSTGKWQVSKYRHGQLILYNNKSFFARAKNHIMGVFKRIFK